MKAFFLPRTRSTHFNDHLEAGFASDCQMAAPMDTGSLKPPTATSTKVTGTRSPLHFHISWIRDLEVLHVGMGEKWRKPDFPSEGGDVSKRLMWQNQSHDPNFTVS